MAGLAYSVYVDGTWYRPKDNVPAKVAAQIRNKAWEGGKRPSGKSGGDPVPPPMSGKGSGIEAWRAYAAAVEVEVDDDAGRDEIVEAIQAAGKPVEQPE